MAAALLVRATVAQYTAAKRLPLNETINMTIDDRLGLGDAEAVHDMVRDAIDELDALADRAASLLCDDAETLKRLSDVRRRQEATGREWHTPFKDADATDRVGTEPRGPRRGQERPRRAKAGKPAKGRRRSC